MSDLQKLAATLLAIAVLLPGGHGGAAHPGADSLDCPAATEAIRVDGDLGEWQRAGARFVNLTGPEPMPAPKNLSADVAARFDSDALYLALHVQDEQIVADTLNFWDADGVDLYLEVGEGPTAHRYRLCLLPYNEGRRFGVVVWDGRRVLGAGGLNGVEAVARELGEGSGAYGIEARIPLHPFGIDPADPPVVRLDVAMRDHDAPDRSETDPEPPVNAKLSLSGRGDLSAGGEKLPRLQFRGSLGSNLSSRTETPSSPGRVALIGALLALALVLLVGFSARRVQRSLLPQLPRWKRIAWPTLAALAIVLVFGPGAVDSVATWRSRADLSRRGTTLKALLHDLSLPEVSARLRSADEGALRELLQGRPVRTTEANRFELIDPPMPPDQHGRGEYVSRDPIPGVPFCEYGVRLGGPRSSLNNASRFDYELPHPEPVRKLHLAVASFLPASDVDNQIVNGLEVRLEFANRPLSEAKAKSFTIDDARNEPIGHLSSTWGRADLRSGRDPDSDAVGTATEIAGLPIRHLDHYVFEVDAGGKGGSADEPQLLRISVGPTAAAGDAIVWISAITVEHGGTPPTYHPLPLGTVDQDGFLMAMRRGNPAPRERRLAPKNPGEEARMVLLDRGTGPPLEVKRLRLYYRAEGSGMPSPDSAMLRVRAAIHVVLDGVDHPVRTQLRAGIEIDNALLPELRHPAWMKSIVASWFETRDGTLHYDGLELPLEENVGTPGPYRIRRIEIEQPQGVPGALVIVGATAVVRAEPPPLPRLTTLQISPTEIAITPEAAAALNIDDRGGFAIARDGIVAQYGGALPSDVGERLRGTRIDAGGRSPSDAPTLTEQMRAGRRFLTCSSTASIGGANLSVVLMRELSSFLPLRSIRDAVAIVVAILALPFVLLLLVDALARVARIRFRLSMLFLLTSLAPFAVLFAVLVNVLGSEQRRAERHRADELLSQVRERVQRLSDLAAADAIRVLKDVGDSRLLADPGVSDDDVRRRLALLAQAFPDRDAHVAIVVETTGEGNERRIQSHGRPGADPRFEAPSVGLATSWGTLVFSGAASNADLKVTVAGVVDASALQPIRLRSDEGESIELIAPLTRRGSEEIEGGEALSGTRVGDRMAGDVARSAARDLDVGRGAFTRDLDGVGTCGFDLLKGAGGDPVAIIAATIGARPPRVDLGFATLELPSFVLALGAVILAASLFLGSAVTDGITRPLARVLRNAVSHAGRNDAPPAEPLARDDAEDEITSLESSFRRLSDELTLRATQQGRLSEVVAVMGRPADLRERARTALDFIHALAGGRELGCWVWSPATSALELVAQRTAAPGTEPFRRSMEIPVAAKSGSDFEPRFVRRADEPELCSDAPSALLLPLERSQRLFGLVVVRLAEAADPLPQLGASFLRGVLDQVAAGLESAQLVARAIEDVETGLYVHSHFLSRLSEEVDRAAHQQRPVALLVVRLAVAHASADGERRVVAAIGRELRRACREREIVGRAAPLEFEILAPYGGRERALELAAELRRRWSEAQGVAEAAGGRLDIGFAVLPDDARSADFLTAVARRRVESAAPVADHSDQELIDRFRRRFPELGFGSARMIPILRQLEKVAPSDATLLILGDTGTGKEVVAQMVHRLSARAEKALVAVHCAAIPEKLLESELFGYEKGAFTGADARRLGRFEQADGGTLFLDEVGEIPLPVQVKLLRVLQEKKVQRLGGGEEIPVDVRVLAATHQPLERLVVEGRFREDLYYRLKVVTLDLPPLRERIDEIPTLFDRFVAARRRSDPACRIRGVEPAALDVLARHPWPGNIRELRNVIERAIVLGNGELIRREDIEFAPVPGTELRPAPAAAPPALASPPAGAATAAALQPPEAPPEGGVRPTPVGIDTAADFSDRQRRILDWIREKGALTSREYCERAGVSQRTALRDLAELVRTGLLIRTGSRKAATYRYKPAERAGAMAP
jgi:DNA-binding NtrC family response regulator/HAMP domain-containing protein